MKNNLILFEKINWEEIALGMKEKRFSTANYTLRLIRFEDDFKETDWCHKGHIGFVLAGEMNIDFGGQIVHFKKGDGLSIETGEKNKHKAIIAKGKFAELILFESN